jgi:hypothetical protein
MFRATWVLAALAAGAAPAIAHPAPFSYLDIRIERAAIDVTIVAHAIDVAHDLDSAGIADAVRLLDPAALTERAPAIVALLRDRLRLRADGVLLTNGVWSAPEPLQNRDSLRVRVRFALSKDAARLVVDARLFPYDPVHQTFVNVYERGTLTAQAILTPGKPAMEHFAGTTQGRLAVIRRFGAAGIHHILIGPDHLLFLVGLLLLGGSLRRLVLVVSAFTAAHSVTLSLAALDVVRAPAWLVEPAIALSIVYVGADNLTFLSAREALRLRASLGPQALYRPRDVRAWIAFAFGLIHGFGFAGVLREMDLPPRALGWSLFSFNVGVEIGQLAVVCAVAWTLALVRARSELAGRRLAVGGSVVVIAAGAYWFVERTFL